MTTSFYGLYFSIFYCNDKTMTLDPFALLGIDPHRSSIKDLKRSYYDLALLVHPDRNREKTGEEMNVVHNAYRYCLEQMQNAKDRETTVEDLEADFADFCKVQTDEPPCFRDITEDVLEMRKFNEAFERAEGFKASLSGGYGDLMEVSAYGDTNALNASTALTEPEYTEAEVVDAPLKNDFSSLIVYREPISVTNGIGDVWDYERKDPVDSYTVYVKKTCLTDYKEANTKQVLDDGGVVRERTYEEIVAERESMDEVFANTIERSPAIAAILEPRPYV